MNILPTVTFSLAQWGWDRTNGLLMNSHQLLGWSNSWPCTVPAITRPPCCQTLAIARSERLVSCCVATCVTSWTLTDHGRTVMSFLMFASHTGCCEFAAFCVRPHDRALPRHPDLMWFELLRPFNLQFMISNVTIILIYCFGRAVLVNVFIFER